MEIKVLDYVLVPVGLAGMVAYHIWLIHQIVKRPTTTFIGINAINRRIWVRAMMQDVKNGVLSVQTLRNNIMASTLLASTAIMLSSLIALLMNNDGCKSSSMGMGIVFGDKSGLGFSIKIFSILACFLVAFLMNVQSVRYYSHASILINVPAAAFYKDKIDKNHPDHHHHHHNHWVTPEYVGSTVNRGGYFWSLGLRAFYFSFPLFLWLFGPIPMFFSCIVLVFLLYFLDVTLDFGWVGGTQDDQDENRAPRDEESNEFADVKDCVTQ